jgi:crotonobetainyl-CoA:carnitine CoA-transferase CaiB-like acyl-CoA transferase
VPRLPLEGLRVLEITVVWAGPYCGSFLADLGAEVIRVESTKTFVPLTRGAAAHISQSVIDNLPLYSGGTPGRVPGDRPFNRSPMFNSHARNKRSMTVNLLDPGGREIFDRLVAISDVLIENNPTETMEKLGISYESLRAVKDDIIMMRMPAYGSDGPYRDYRAHGVHIEGVVGHTMLRGYEDTDPSYNTTVLMSDAAAGAQGAFAVLAALRHRKRTGEGQLVELGQAENVFSFLGEYYLDYAMNGRIHGTLGNRHPRALQNCYPCAGENRWIAITIYDNDQWRTLCDIIGAAQMRDDPELADHEDRNRHQDVIDPVIAEWTQGQTPEEAMRKLQEHGISAGAVMTQADAFDDPHIQSREFFHEASQEDCGTHLYPGPLYRMSETPLGIRRGPVMFGQDNEYVYRELLGYSEAEYAEFEAAGHIGTDYAPGVG